MLPEFKKGMQPFVDSQFRYQLNAMVRSVNLLIELINVEEKPPMVLVEFVLLEKTGGSPGTPTTQCTYVYTAKTQDGVNTLATGLTPKLQRPPVGLMISGNGLIGMGYWKWTGAAYIFELFNANEVIDAASCPTP